MTEPPPGRPTVVSILALMRVAGTTEESSEEIPGLTNLHHGLQCASHLRRSDPGDPELLVAGLLHDLGHVLAPGCEDSHGAVGAEYVRPLFGQRVAALIEAHVPAKRYLVTSVGSYRAQLSAGSIRTLAVQGGPMTADESAAFRSSPYFDAAVQLRRADERAKDPDSRVPTLDSWIPTLELVAG
jgi:predicted HD phosphohydrolase